MNYKITIENYKSILFTQFELRQGLNILIGPNGAGKTCALSSLKFLKDILQKGVALAMAIGGGPSRIFHRGKRTIRFQVEIDYGSKIYNRRRHASTCKWSLAIEQKGIEKIATIVNESVVIEINSKSNPIPLFRYDAIRNRKSPKNLVHIDPKSGRDLFNRYSDEHRANSKNDLFVQIDSKLREISNSPEFKRKGEKSILTLLSNFDSTFDKIFQFLTSLTEYNIIPERARQATEQVPFARMSPNGFGISEVIEALEKRNFQRFELDAVYDYEMGMYSSFNRFYKYYYPFRRRFPNSRIDLVNAFDSINRELSAAVKPITKVSVEIDQTNGRRFVIFKSDDDRFYPDEVSDGTIKWLCILTSIYVGFSNVYLLEEPENFLHPWMQQKLIQIMREHSKKSETIYVLTTHSTTLLNSAYPTEVITVQQKSKGTELARIENEVEIQTFLENSDFRLGDLWVSGGIGAIPQ